MLLLCLMNFQSDVTQRKKVDSELQMYVFIVLVKRSCRSEQKQHLTLVSFSLLLHMTDFLLFTELRKFFSSYFWAYETLTNPP